MKGADNYCVRQACDLVAAFDSQFNCLCGDRLYYLVLSLRKSISRLVLEDWCEASDSLVRMSRYLAKIAKKVKVKIKAIGRDDTEMCDLGEWLSFWCEVKSSELITWRRVNFMRLVAARDSTKVLICSNNVVALNKVKKAA